ncbi:hypothetical protein RSSM_01743 [Rhodopirellula sallentina SM41]|uniref:Uncharacterized protein n=1 Tax=Rhodopirellula sallentina SM41 TaxID=1263870 RepID=M5U5S5_9BACT|nr:hypothetical protein RSSM_01743 [Rhodopirellula sallentina SM41]
MDGNVGAVLQQLGLELSQLDPIIFPHFSLASHSLAIECGNQNVLRQTHGSCLVIAGSPVDRNRSERPFRVSTIFL